MLSFSHPEYLHLLWAIPIFVLLYGLIRLQRKKKAEKKGQEFPKKRLNPKFTITNGWFICSIFCLVYAILIVGFASPVESDESSRQNDSREIQLMLAFDSSSQKIDSPVAKARIRILKELEDFTPGSTRVTIGAISSSNATMINTLTDDFDAVRKFITSNPPKANEDGNCIARTIEECSSRIKWETGAVKNGIIILTDREKMTREEIDAAKKAAKKAAKGHIFTYIVGTGENADDPDFKEIINAGKGIYIEDDATDVTLTGLVNVIKKNHRVTFIDILNYFLLTVFFLVTPALAIFLCKRYSWLGKLGPIMVLYGVGMLLGSIKINGASLFPNEITAMQNILSTAMVPLAIPLMLYSCVFNKKEIGRHFTAMITGLAGVVIAVVLGYFLCKDHVHEANKVAGMLTGVYTGGTINMAAIKESLQADNQTYILIQTYDIVICLAYLVFLLLGGFKLFRKWLPNTSQLVPKGKKHQLSPEEMEEQKKLEEDLKFEEQGFSSIFTRQGMKNTLVLLGTTLGLVALSAGITLLVSGGQLNMTIFFLLITTFAILMSYVKNIHNRKEHYNIGLYCIYIFSLVIATMADFSSLKESLTTDYWMPTFVFMAVFGSLLISALLGKLFKVDADTMVITSVAYINSPAFVPMISAAMRNRKTLIPGLTIGVIGFAVGNYLGTMLAYLLP